MTKYLTWIVLGGCLVGCGKSFSVTGPAGDSSGPSARIISAPADGVISSGFFTFSALDNVSQSSEITYECSLNSDPYLPCTSPYFSSGFASGLNQLRLKARDKAGNGSVASHSWNYLLSNISAVPLNASILGQNFEHIGPRNAWNGNFVTYQGDPNWFSLEVRPGERRASESGNTTIERVGLDGYTGRLVNRRIGSHRLEFSIVPGENSLAVAAGDWWNFFEIHALEKAIDAIQPAGPLRFSMEYSVGAQGNILRIWRQEPVEVGGSLQSVNQSILYQTTSGISVGQRLDFAVEFREHPISGFVNVWMNGAQIVTYTGQFGYDIRDLYPQFRMYRNARTTIAQALFKLSGFSSTLYVIESGEVLFNPSFQSNINGWLTDFTTSPATITWQSDGSGGGRALMTTNGTANARMSQQFATRPGATYRLIFSGPPAGRFVMSIGSTRGAADILGFQQAGTYQFVATGTTAWVNYVSNVNGLVVDQVSVEKLFD